MAKKKKEKKVENKEQPKLYSREELAPLLGVSRYRINSLYSIRGIDKNTKLSLEQARELFEKIV